MLARVLTLGCRAANELEELIRAPNPQVEVTVRREQFDFIGIAAATTGGHDQVQILLPNGDVAWVRNFRTVDFWSSNVHLKVDLPKDVEIAKKMRGALASHNWQASLKVEMLRATATLPSGEVFEEEEIVDVVVG